jgi:hypothetical protein
MSSFIERMENVCRKILDRMEKVSGNEQATKESLIKPFFTALGYDTEDPDSWLPEYNADFPGKKRSEKVDYAVIRDGEPVIFIEAKAYNGSDSALVSKDGQLARYFNAKASVRISIITNGVLYRFFTDLSHENIQDEEPFWVFDIRNAKKQDFETLEMFAPPKIDVGAIRAWGDDHKSNVKVREFLKTILSNPEKSSEFVKFVLDQTYDGVKSKSVVEALTSKISNLMREAIDGCIKERLGLMPSQNQVADNGSSQPDDINTTVEELSAFATIKGVLSGAGRDTSALRFKDYSNWMNVSYKRNGNWFIRLYFNETPKFITVRLPVDRIKTLVGDSLEIQQRSSGASIPLSDPAEIDRFAKLICEAYDQCMAGKMADTEAESDDSKVAS